MTASSAPFLPRDRTEGEHHSLSQATEAFLRVAKASTHRVGLSVDARCTLVDEMVDHLVAQFEGAVSRGAEASTAKHTALSAFGDSESIRRGLTAARLSRELRRAFTLPSTWIGIIIIDALAGVAHFAHLADWPFSPRAWAPPFMSALALLWFVSAALRFGWWQCGHGLAKRVTALEYAAGAGFVGIGLGLGLYWGPGRFLPMLCDLIDAAAGRDIPIAVTAWGGGLAAAALGLLGGAWFRTHQPTIDA